ncbi:unnamed protein product [Fraxinus pennsylvanica]|uniref:RING-type domain-containing protein n=1 Tax=Fraxinus pennsylvanica TaxID=56036 RepID=A0AAD1ZW75_9LAMI|nr:unnamed protein product [Fraxinus pennsylvanica]
METGAGGGRCDGNTESLQRSGSNRLLFNVIGEDPTYGHGKDSKMSWRHLREKLRLRRSGSGSAWTSTMHIPTSDVPINPRQYSNADANNTSNNRNRMMARHASTRYSSDSGESAPPDISAVPDVDMELMSNRGSRAPILQRNVSQTVERNMRRAMERKMSRASGKFEHTNSLAMRRSRGLDGHEDDDADQTPYSAEGESENEEGDEDGGGAQEKPVRMSLMDLLAETEGSAYAMEEDEDDEDDDDHRGGGGGGYSNCSICMVRHKGAAFIQCGHTFCRLCSRELCFQKGNCPLCNNYILEILDIF